MDKNKFKISLHEEEKELIETINELNEKLSAIQSVLKVYEKDFTVANENLDLFSSSAIVPKSEKAIEKEKTDNSTIVSRTLEALELLGSATANEVGSTINELYPYIPVDKARLDSRITLSRLKTAGQISSEKIPGQLYFLYKFIKQEEAVELQPQ